MYAIGGKSLTVKPAFLIFISTIVATTTALLAITCFQDRSLLKQSGSKITCKSLAVIDASGSERIKLEINEGNPEITMSSSDRSRSLKLRIVETTGQEFGEPRTELRFLKNGKTNCYIAQIGTGINTILLGETESTNNISLSTTGVESYQAANIKLGGINSPSKLSLKATPEYACIDFSDQKNKIRIPATTK